MLLSSMRPALLGLATTSLAGSSSKQTHGHSKQEFAIEDICTSLTHRKSVRILCIQGAL
jgi:hypothetical protein